MDDFLEELSLKCNDDIDLKSLEDSSSAEALASEILMFCKDEESLDLFENRLFEQKRDLLPLHLGIKLAKSKFYVSQIKNDVFLSVCFAMYKENNRMQKIEDHPHGENFLVRKVKQIQWLLENVPSVSFKITAVDDGCPDSSGMEAEKIIERENLGEFVDVAYLMEAPEESQKGGSIHLGLKKAVERSENNNHIALFTDADLSTHLGQCGLLMHPILSQDKLAAIGSRRLTFSKVIKNRARNERGKLFIYLWKRMIPPLNFITDTQCGFKAFRADILRPILENPLERKFAFDIELLLRLETNHLGKIEKVPLAWFDSEAASTTTSLSPYLSMLKKIALMGKTYLKPTKEAAEFITFVDSLDEEKFERIVANIPKEISTADPSTFDRFNGVKPSDFR